MGDVNEGQYGAKDALVEAFSSFGSDALRDVWLFDQNGHEGVYLRDDIERKLSDVDVAKFVDNERYGYVTRETYGDLYYADYEYTVRGFDEFELFRTFLSEGDDRIGTFASFDPAERGCDYRTLHDTICDVVADYPIEAFAPE